jgi:carboxyl-terminal processing protease
MLCIKKYLFVIILILAAVVSSCKDNEVALPETRVDTASVASYPEVNQWMYEIMNDAYFWYASMPSGSALDKTLKPTGFFEKLVYQRTSIDRFSKVTNDTDALEKEFNGVSKIFGLSYTLAYLDDTKTSLGLFLNLVVKGSPAEAAGLKRGDIILKVNGGQLTASNYQTLLADAQTAEFTLGTLTNGKITASGTTVSVTKAEVSENPIAFSTVIPKPKYGKVIGYLVYTQFVPGTEMDEKKYDNELRKVFADFKTKGVNELVLDLRFNPGGYTSSAETLASLIGKDVSPSKIFYKEKWNDKYATYWKKKKGIDALNVNFTNEANNIGASLSRVFVLTSNGTASASELVINGLKPYMEVITIGTHTAGKNLFGALIGDDRKRWKWGVYVMLGQTANVHDQSDYGTVNGITPTYVLEDSSVPFEAFGNENETLFRKALDIMGIPANEGGRLSATVAVGALTGEPLRDNLTAPEKRMITNRPIPGTIP